MRIQFTPQYYISNINNSKNQTNKQHKKNNNINNSYNPIAYQDYNISFGARTPENFYEFNAESMPYSMRNYLNYNKEERQHIPPEQMMNEVFKHLDNAKNFEEVKTLYYPNEDLFKNLHPLKKNSRKGILSEIKVARDLSDTPLLKDRSDDFGMYLLKKIYKEGKTLKEISKDFLEKDINDEYKGFITEPITYDTTSAYGIKFPNNGFWHSFISTREEYKKFFVTLPKNMVDPNRTEAVSKSGHSISKTADNNDVNIETPQKHIRKYTIPKFKKDLLKKEIKTANADAEGIEKAVRKRFSKNDPEASFIIKYLSPIMTVAADKVHLSEEMKYFYEFDDGNNQIGKSKIDRFWKSNPELLENYSTAITDTIELFEDVYGAGGLIPINNTFEVINSKTENQKIIDHVTPEFIELLEYTQRIKPLRDERYAKHDAEQTEWEAHFAERYGNNTVDNEYIQNNAPVVADEDEITVDKVQEAMDKAVAANPGTKFYDFELANGTKLSFAVNLEEVLRDRLSVEYCNMPNSFVHRFTKFFLKHPKASEKMLLSIACSGKELKDLGELALERDYTEDELENLNKEIIDIIGTKLYSAEEIYKTMHEIEAEFAEKNPKFMERVKQAVMEYSTRLKTPDTEYLKQLITERFKQMEESGLIQSNLSDEDRISAYNEVLKQATTALKAMKSHNIVYLNSKTLESGLSFLRIGNTIEDQGTEMDKIIQKYNTPLSNSEKSKILRVFMDSLLSMNPNETESFKIPQLSGFFKSIINVLKQKKYGQLKKDLANLISKEVITSDNTTLRYLIDPNADKNLLDAKVEIEISKLMQTHTQIFKTIASADSEIMDKYISDTILYQSINEPRFHI